MSRASSWLIGAALGGSAACAAYLLCIVGGWPWTWQIGATVAMGVALFVPGIEYAWQSAVAARAYWLNPEQAIVGAFVAADDDRPEDLGDDERRQPTPLVGGYLLDEAEQYIYTGLLRLFQHAAAAGSLTSTALIPAAFTQPEQWVYWTDLAAKSGLCVKANGVATALPPSRTYAWAVGEIRKGNIIWPTADSPAPQPLPHPFAVGLIYKAEPQKAGKGGPKVDKVAGGYGDDD